MNLKKIFILFLMLSSQALAGDVLQKGSVLTEDSIVFTLEEAQTMRSYISGLEEDVKVKEEVIAQYRALDEVQQVQIETYQEYLMNKERQLNKYLEIQKLDEQRISTLERQAKISKLDKAIAFGGGVAITIGLLIVADKIDDGLEK